MKTASIHYETLTWPEVAALPRDLPLALPLGGGYSLEGLSNLLANPPQIGLLPSIPFGWQGSGLTVPEEQLSRLVSNLLDGLREDGFTRAYALTPPGLELGLGADQLVLAPETAPLPLLLPSDSERGKVVIIPIGHTEQHGFHLPLSTDTLIIEAIGRSTASAVPDSACCLPVMPYGVSTHRSSFAGTLNCGGRAFEDFWVGVIDSLAGRGFDRFYLLSGHGGNSSFLVNIVKYAGERHRRCFCATAWLYLSGPQGVDALQKYRRSPIGGMGHACELETSLILHLRPDLAHMERAIDETDFVSTASYYMDWVEGGALVANPPWDDDTFTGAYGAGSLATAENGRLWLVTAIAEKIGHIHEIHEQHTRREARRTAGYGLWGKNNP
jgi:creatinine amidohydrolase